MAPPGCDDGPEHELEPDHRRTSRQRQQPAGTLRVASILPELSRGQLELVANERDDLAARPLHELGTARLGRGPLHHVPPGADGLAAVRRDRDGNEAVPVVVEQPRCPQPRRATTVRITA